MATRSTEPHRTVLATMWTGLALTVAAAVYPFVDRATSHRLADHIRAGYPSYSDHRIDNAVTAYLVILAAVGALGIVGWLAVIWAESAGKSWTRWMAVGIFTVALCLVVTGLTVTDTSGDVGLAPAIGWTQVLPCVPGLLAIMLLWKPRR